MPTLPPPGGDVPAYMSYVNEAKAQYEATKKQNKEPVISPPILKKIPIPMSAPVPKKRPLPPPEKNFFSMLPNWFQDSSGPAPKEDRIGQNAAYKETLPKVASSVPRLPPPQNFPSFEKAKGKRPQENRRRPPLEPRRSRPHPRPPHPTYPDFNLRSSGMVKTKPPLQLIPRQPPHEQLHSKPQKKTLYNPKRHLKLGSSQPSINRQKTGLLQRILSLPEKLPKLPYLSSSMSVPSIEAGNATTSEINMAGKSRSYF